VTRRDYTEEKVEAAHSVLIELIHLLGQYRDDIVLIGGWVPEVLIPNKTEPYVGTMDVDIALDHKKLKEEGYRTIEQILLGRGYRKGDQPFIYYRTVKIGNTDVDVQVDLLAGEYGGTGKSHRHQQMQDIQARKVRGCDLAFEMTRTVTIEGPLPEGGKDRVSIRVASIVPFFIMKGMALDDRLKEKDAWDLYYCLRYYLGGLDAIVEEFKPHIQHGLVKEGLQKIAKHFESITNIGPEFVVNFYDETDPETRDMVRRDAFERMNYILEKLGLK